MNRPGKVLLALVALSMLLPAATASGARLVRCRILLEGQQVLYGIADDNGRQDAATVWGYLNDVEFEPQDGYRVEPDEKVPATATLRGKIVIDVQYSGKAEVDSVKLVRSKRTAGHWVLAAGEVERTRAAIARGEADMPQYGFAVGKSLPLLVVDFVNPTGYGHCGCVSVMIRNRKQRGVVVLTRSLDESVIELCRRLEKEELIGGDTQGYLVVFGKSATTLKEPAAQWGLTKFTINAARRDAVQWSQQVGLPDDTDTAVCLINIEPITYAWSTSDGKLTDDQQAEIVAAVKELHTQPLLSPAANDELK